MENNNVPVQPGTPVKPDRKGLAVASLVLGIVSVVLVCFVYVSIPCAILGIIFGALAKDSSKAGMAKAGLILSIIGVGLVILVITVFASLIAGIMGTAATSGFNY